ncbi:hypothetical protein BB8028_0011g00010 [Beauveria bassiana]|uniref:Uncharacterized protein n=1 Tax=Beauveria bassiana TaxID=176275 RepID=A0A2S7YQG8_BEABA|nr:hypothetical protein BB8028_0011g00010 [Beauveria bassiana]
MADSDFVTFRFSRCSAIFRGRFCSGAKWKSRCEHQDRNSVYLFVTGIPNQCCSLRYVSVLTKGSTCRVPFVGNITAHPGISQSGIRRQFSGPCFVRNSVFTTGIYAEEGDGRDGFYRGMNQLNDFGPKYQAVSGRNCR